MGNIHGILLVFLLINVCAAAFGAKILVLHPIYASSHALALRSVADALADRGHQVDIIKWRDEHIDHFGNHTNITVTTLSMDNSDGKWAFLTKEKQAAFKIPYELITAQGVSLVPNITVIFRMSKEAFMLKTQCETLLENKELYNKFQKEKYDVAIIDLAGNECGLALLHQLKIPIVGFWAVLLSSGPPEHTTASLPPSYVPAYFSKLGHEMNFFERAFNLVFKIGAYFAMHCHFYLINQEVQKYYPGTPYPSDLLKNLNGMLINSDPVWDYPTLLPPSFINVGGLQIREPKPLPKDIEAWIESSGEHGIVLLSMGFTHDLNLVSKNVVSSFMEAFSQFQQNFIVKYEGTVDNIPANVKIVKWVPQQDILAHPRAKAFITHCGANGITEAVYNGVPIVGMPLAIDQGDNLVKILKKGIAVGLDKETATTEDIFHSLNEILLNPKYKRNAEKLSRLMRDVKETPRQRSVNFIEYIIRHKGAEHLKLASRHLNLIQYFSLDTMPLLMLCSLVFLFVMYKSIKFIIHQFGCICKIIFKNIYHKSIYFISLIIRNISTDDKKLD